MQMGNKRCKELYLKVVFCFWPGPRIWGLGNPVGFLWVPFLTIPKVPSQTQGQPNNQGSHKYSFRFFLKEAFRGMPQGSEKTWGNFGSSSGQQNVQLDTCGQGLRRLLCLLPSTSSGPRGKPSFPITRRVKEKENKNHVFETILYKHATHFDGE